MITALLYYSAASAILLPGIEAWRIKKRWGKTKNINHTISAGLALLAAVGCWIVANGLTISWQAIPFAFACFAVRGLFYDGSLNLMRRLPFDHISQTTSSGIDQRLNRVSFWKRRAIYAGVLAIVLLINYFI